MHSTTVLYAMTRRPQLVDRLFILQAMLSSCVEQLWEGVHPANHVEQLCGAAVEHLPMRRSPQEQTRGYGTMYMPDAVHDASACGQVSCSLTSGDTDNRVTLPAATSKRIGSNCAR
jgi:hypothetical protein